jgi:NDP-sugar pyrophosphorylase family protein
LFQFHLNNQALKPELKYGFNRSIDIKRDSYYGSCRGTRGKVISITLYRSKPSVPFGGKYRIIDFALSNCLNSGLRRIYILVQYKSDSLNQHLFEAWSIFNPELVNLSIQYLPKENLITTGISALPMLSIRI